MSRFLRQLEAAQRLSQALFQHLTPEAVVAQALRTALDVVNAEAGCVLLSRPESRELVFYHSIGSQAPPPGTAFPWDKGIAGSVFQRGEVVLTRDAQQDARHYAAFDEATGFTTRELLALPLKRWDGDAIGVVEVINKRDGSFDQEDVAILTVMAAFSAVSIEQARLFQEARLAEVARVLGNIGHDIKNLLMPIFSGASLLQTELKDSYAGFRELDDTKVEASQRFCNEMIEMLVKNGHRIHDRVKEMADCVKGIVSPPRFASCQTSKVIESVFEALRALASEKHIHLSHEGLETLPTLLADERRLFNAFYNLVHNAVEEVPQGGKIGVRGTVSQGGDRVVISVSDNGPGMPPELMGSLFSRNAVSKKPAGTGLGSQIVKQAVECHGGAVRIESTLGAGSTVSVELPLRPAGA